MPGRLNVVTGAFGFTGKHITRVLLEEGEEVRTLTNHPRRPDPFSGLVEVRPLSFDVPALVENLRGADVLFNTYWVRFDWGEVSFERAVENSKALVRAAREAGVKKFVHISITNPGVDSVLPYFRGKALVERALREAGLSYAIVRPTVLFGDEDILINNIAWLLRTFPVFGVFGKGDYRLQPVYVDDVAEMAVELSRRSENVITDAAGPEVYTYEELVLLIRGIVGSRARVVHIPPHLGHTLSGVLNPFLRDIVITRDEVVGLMAELLVSSQPSICPTRLSVWLRENADRIGKEYRSELGRHYK